MADVRQGAEEQRGRGAEEWGGFLCGKARDSVNAAEFLAEKALADLAEFLGNIADAELEVGLHGAGVQEVLFCQHLLDCRRRGLARVDQRYVLMQYAVNQIPEQRVMRAAQHKGVDLFQCERKEVFL